MFHNDLRHFNDLKDKGFKLQNFTALILADIFLYVNKNLWKNYFLLRKICGILEILMISAAS